MGLGFTESWYLNSAPVDLAHAQAVTIAPARNAMLGAGVWMQFCRTVDTNNPGVSRITAFDFPVVPITDANAANYSRGAIVVRIQAANGLYKRTMTLRGVPDSWIAYNSSYYPVLPGPALNPLGNWITNCINQGVGLKVLNKLANVPLQIVDTSLAAAGGSQLTFTTAAAHGFVPGQYVRVSKVRGKNMALVPPAKTKTINAVWPITGVDVTGTKFSVPVTLLNLYGFPVMLKPGVVRARCPDLDLPDCDQWGDYRLLVKKNRRRLWGATWAPIGSAEGVTNHPCGMVVDFLQRAYQTKMVFYPGPEEDVIWYRPRKAPGSSRGGTLSVPGYGRTACATLTGIAHLPDGWVRCRAASYYHKGEDLLGLPGRSFCGSLDTWAGLATAATPTLVIDDKGGSACCGAAPDIGAGGPSVGGVGTLASDIIVNAPLEICADLYLCNDSISFAGSASVSLTFDSDPKPLYLLVPSGDSTVTSAVPLDGGQTVALVNRSSDTITFADSGAATLPALPFDLGGAAVVVNPGRRSCYGRMTLRRCGARLRRTGAAGGGFGGAYVTLSSPRTLPVGATSMTWTLGTGSHGEFDDGGYFPTDPGSISPFRQWDLRVWLYDSADDSLCGWDDWRVD